MATNTKFKFDPADQGDELGALRVKFSKLQTKYDRLEVENDVLKVRLEEAKKGPPPKPKLSSIFLVIAAMLTAARLILLWLVEQWGMRDQAFGVGAWAVFGVVGGIMLIAWTFSDFGEDQWITAGSAIFLAVMIVISISIYDPHLLEDWTLTPISTVIAEEGGRGGAVLIGSSIHGGIPQHPIAAAITLIASLLFAATPTFGLIVGALFLLVSKAFRRNS